jgi:hypothetical protein
MLFEKLTLILVCLLQHKFGPTSACRWGTTSQLLQDSIARASFGFDELVLRHEDIAISTTPVVDVFDSPRRFGQLWARVCVDRPDELRFLSDIELQRAGEPWIQLKLTEEIPLDCVKTISVELNFHQHNVRAPKPSHPR